MEENGDWQKWSPFAKTYDPLKSGSIDGTDTIPHDHALIRALTAKYKPPHSSVATPDPEKTLFVGRLNLNTSENGIRHEFSQYGTILQCRLIRDVVTGVSRGYAFVQFKRREDAERTRRDAHHSILDGREILVDWENARTMPDWIPRRLGGGFGGKKESGQLRFGGRDRPFRKPILIQSVKKRARFEGDEDNDNDRDWEPHRDEASTFKKPLNTRDISVACAETPDRKSTKRSDNYSGDASKDRYTKHSRDQGNSDKSDRGIKHRPWRDHEDVHEWDDSYYSRSDHDRRRSGNKRDRGGGENVDDYYEYRLERDNTRYPGKSSRSHGDGEDHDYYNYYDKKPDRDRKRSRESRDHEDAQEEDSSYDRRSGRSGKTSQDRRGDEEWDYSYEEKLDRRKKRSSKSSRERGDYEERDYSYEEKSDREKKRSGKSSRDRDNGEKRDYSYDRDRKSDRGKKRSGESSRDQESDHSDQKSDSKKKRSRKSSRDREDDGDSDEPRERKSRHKHKKKHKEK